MAESVEKEYQPPVDELGPGQTSYTSITDKISGVVFTHVKNTPIFWFLSFAFGFLCLHGLMIGAPYLLYEGTGIWGLNNPVGWGWAIINFIWWIGIGHAGTLISAILLLFRQRWRTSINRAAEAMTIFAVLCAAQFPLLHTGRPWLAAYWLLPYPNSMAMWVNFRSPLIWDVFAVSTYLTVSLVFWYVGLIPDLATFRDKAKNRIAQIIYGFLALGWRGSAFHWERYELASLILAGLSTPLVLSVHSIVSFDFSTGILPGWHTTIFPPYFVAGAIFAGFAMVLTLMIPLRRVYGLYDFITDRHLNNMSKVMLVAGLIVAYGYFMEVVIAEYSGSQWEMYMMRNRMFGPYGNYYWALILCNIVVPQLLWFRYFRLHPIWLWVVCQFINVGMWLERFVIVVMSLHRDFMPSSWGSYNATIWDAAIFIGTIGLFTVLFFLFIRGFPMISIHEIRTLLKTGKH